MTEGCIEPLPPTSSTMVFYDNAGLRVRRYKCEATPDTPAFEEAHSEACVALVLSGTYQYRSSAGQGTLVPGSLLIGRRCECYECSHVDDAGDDNLVFDFSDVWLERTGLSDIAGHRSKRSSASVPPASNSANLMARAIELTHLRLPTQEIEELALQLVASSLDEPSPDKGSGSTHSVAALRRVSDVVRWIDQNLDGDCSLDALARSADLSTFHFCRSFKHITGQTPAQFVLGRRLQRAAELLSTSTMPVISVALEAGFGDLSHFNASFRRFFQHTPMRWRGRTANYARRPKPVGVG